MCTKQWPLNMIAELNPTKKGNKARERVVHVALLSPSVVWPTVLKTAVCKRKGRTQHAFHESIRGECKIYNK